MVYLKKLKFMPISINGVSDKTDIYAHLYTVYMVYLIKMRFMPISIHGALPDKNEIYAHLYTECT